jgi:hypothetical protein
MGGMNPVQYMIFTLGLPCQEASITGHCAIDTQYAGTVKDIRYTDFVLPSDTNNGPGNVVDNHLDFLSFG